MMQESIQIRGARENNLKNISLRIPKRKITIFTGVSGSGKSSIVFDTIAKKTCGASFLTGATCIVIKQTLIDYSSYVKAASAET